MDNIAKTPQAAGNLSRPAVVSDNARGAFKSFLMAARLSKKEKVLLPAYIGWSSREGSGVFDPISGLGLSYDFYRMTGKLEIDLPDLEKAFKRGRVKVLVLIHYFGFVDRNYDKAIAMAKKHGALIVEDEAHSMLTDLIGGLSGRLGNVSIFSLHKLLPVKKGGLMVINRLDPDISSRLPHVSPEQTGAPWNYDLKSISEKRTRNLRVLLKLLAPMSREIEPLRKSAREGEIPQTCPVVVKNVPRDGLYFMMNRSGYGVVSLYHTMIAQLTESAYPDAFTLSARILNLPVHQDINEPMLKSMVARLNRCISALR